MKQAARLLLEEKISRRGFMSRLGRVGVASAAASGLAGTLEAGASREGGRVLRDKTGGELMA